jgi:replication factor C large subunit
MNLTYTSKYAPKKLEGLAGNEEKIDFVRQWILQWLSGKRRKPLLVYGPPGVGKTTLAYAIKEEYDLDLIEMNASELRNKGRVERVLGGSTLAGSLFGRGKIILIDDVDVLAGKADFGGGGAIAAILRESSFPIIVTASDIWDKKLTGIRAECEPLEMKSISKVTIRKVVERVAKAEKVDISEEKLAAICEGAQGDMRAALNDLQALLPTSRSHEKDIFQLVRGILKAESYGAVRDVIGFDSDYNTLKMWMDENIPYEYEDASEVAAAYDSLSKADIFDRRINQSRWVLLKYSVDLATAGVALAKAKAYRKFTKYQFPGYLRSMSATVARRAILKSIGLKIGPKVHTNRREALDYLPILKSMGGLFANQLMDFYGFSEDELAFVLETSVVKVAKTKEKK